MRTPLLPVSLLLPASLLLSACAGPEEGLDETYIEGTLTIPPVDVAELDNRGANDAAPQGLGPEGSSSLSFRALVLTGEAAALRKTPGGEYEDPDNYVFAPAADGDFSISFDFTTGASTGADGYLDDIVFELDVIDTTTGASVVGGPVSTDGTGGTWAATFAATKGVEYQVVVGGIYGETASTAAYTMIFSGSTPDDDDILVGAYTEGDPAVATNPVGGATATGWTFDAATLTWSGVYNIQFVRSVEVVPDEDTGDLYIPPPAVDEALSEVYLMAGTLSSLNASPSAGALYTSAAVQVSINHADVVVDSPLVLDAVFPKVIGLTVDEVLPDTTVAIINADDYNSLATDQLVAQDIGVVSGFGFVDVLNGSITFDPAYEGWNGGNDSDAWQFTVPDYIRAKMTVTWTDPSTDLDIGIWGDTTDYGGYGVIDWMLFGDTYCLTSADPEICTLEVALDPAYTYYVVVLGYAGSDEMPYTVELEWLPG